jgi:AcrR family transcriptional regulator
MSFTKKISTRIQVKPQPSRKIGKSERTRAAILNSAVDFLWTHPFRDLTVGSLMSGTDVGRSSFYQHFQDLHELMEILLDMLRDETLSVTGAWFEGVGDPVVLLKESLGGLVEVCYHRGPILRAIADAAATDKRLENAWNEFKRQFDDAVSSRIEADQRQGLIAEFAARPVAIALNRLDAYTLIDAFGQRPRSKREPVKEALTRIWIPTLYGSECLESDSSGLIRK